MIAAKPATEAVYSISNVGGENLLVNTDSGVDLTYSSSEKYSRQSLYNMEKINNEVEFNKNLITISWKLVKIVHKSVVKLSNIEYPFILS